jgi:hypothetical protein
VCVPLNIPTLAGLSIKDDAVEDRPGGPARPIDSCSRRTGAPQASATRRDRAELNQGEDFPPRDRLPAPRSADRQVAHLSTVVPVLRACYESRCGD